MPRLHEATTFVVFTALVALVSVAYLSTTGQIVSEWVYNGPYTHGFLALALGFWVVWQKRHKLTIESRPSLLPTLVILGGSAVWLAGAISNTFLLSASGQFAALVGASWMVFGWRGLMTLFPVFGCILLVLPIWGMLQVPLQTLSIWVTYFALDIIGIPTLKQGIFFTVPGGRFAVEIGCSGLGFLLCSMLLAIVYSHFNNHSLPRAIRLFIFAILLALVTNWLRIIIIMLVGNHTQMQHAIVTDHLTFGWVVFAVALVPFYWIANRQDDGLEEVNESTESGGVSLYAGHAWLFGLVAVLLLLAPLVSKYFDSQQQMVEGNSEWLIRTLNAQLGQPQPSGLTSVNPTFVGASDIWQGHYQLNNRPLTAVIVRYDRQTQGQELIFVENSLLDTNRWHSPDTAASDESLPASVEIWKEASNSERAVVSWYLIGPFVASHKLMAKFYELLAFFSGDQSAYLVAIVMDRPRAEDLEAIQSSANHIIAEITHQKSQNE